MAGRKDNFELRVNLLNINLAHRMGTKGNRETSYVQTPGACETFSVCVCVIVTMSPMKQLVNFKNVAS